MSDATTLDVEKIIQEQTDKLCAHLGITSSILIADIRSVFRSALARAREPLVAAMQAACRNMQLGYDQQARNILDAALTGTEEKTIDPSGSGGR